MIKRVFLIVLDSFGIGALPDAARFGDECANTLASVANSEQFCANALADMGLFNIDGVTCKLGACRPEASFARLVEQSNGKDTTVGHWEIAGCVTRKSLPTYPNGFPRDIIVRVERAAGRKIICNKPYSGTQVIADYGERQLKTGELIVYTSADSVFQIAANESVIPLQELYAICEKTRKILTDSGEHAVGRVVARPFVGESALTFTRTANRHDYSLSPPQKTMLNYLSESGLDVIAVGKINDIFNGSGVTHVIKTKGNDEGMDVACSLAESDFTGLAFINLVDFDMLFGHRNNVDGYARAIAEFDARLAAFKAMLLEDDVLIITADHGCDPGYAKHTDHTREYVPMLIYGEQIRRGVNLGTRDSFADIGATICESFTIENTLDGMSFLGEVIDDERDG